MKRTFVLLALAAAVAGTFVIATPAADTPSIKITHPAASGAGGEFPTDGISGVVAGAPSGARVVVFCFAGDTWWVQPWANSCLTSYAGSTWSTTTHLGEKYVALLVRPSFKTSSPVSSLPSVGGDVLAKSEEVAGRK